MVYSLDSPLCDIPSLEKKIKKPLEENGITTLKELLYLAPRRYEDRRKLDALVLSAQEEPMCIEAEVISVKQKFMGSRRCVEAHCQTQVGGLDGSRVICRWFHMPGIQKQLAGGQWLSLFGKVREERGTFVIYHPTFEIIQEEASLVDSPHWGGFVAVYPFIGQNNQRRYREMLRALLANLESKHLFKSSLIECHIPGFESPFQSLNEALLGLHFPQNLEQSKQARAYFALEEYFELQRSLLLAKQSMRGLKGFVLGKKTQLLTTFYKQLPFELTTGQKRCIKEIAMDMRRDIPMQRLLQGDVGSGKTCVAMCAMLLAIESGKQALLMAPTQILAEQHYETFCRMLAPLGIRVGLKTAARNEQNTMPLEGTPQIWIGTHALLYATDIFEDVGLVIIDEQHKFSVEQRDQLAKRPVVPDVLVMTATPIPRTLTLSVYGDLELSLLDSMPKGRGEIVTALRSRPPVGKMVDFLKKHLSAGRQAYLVYPLVEQSDAIKADAATEAFEQWKKRLTGFQVALLHGKMKPQEKEKTMRDFSQAKSQVLVATSVIEVGIDVPNANIMIVFNSERFGLAQLHQLRGRIGRGEHKSYCVLTTEVKAAETLKKLHVLVESRDGFRIAQADLELRGPGEVLGTVQSGLGSLRYPEFLNDSQLIERARNLAKASLGMA